MNHARETVLARQEEQAAWFIAAARPERPLPRTAPRPTREDATSVFSAAHARSQTLTRDQRTVSPLKGLEPVAHNPRPGLRRWVFSTLRWGSGRGIYTELHHDGSVVLAADLSWKAARESLSRDGLADNTLLVHQSFTGACCRDAVATAHAFGQQLHVDGVLQLTATIVTAEPLPLLAPVVVEFGAFTDIPDHAHHPHRIQPVTTELLPLDEDEALQNTAQDLFTDLMNQFGLDPHL